MANHKMGQQDLLMGRVCRRRGGGFRKKCNVKRREGESECQKNSARKAATGDLGQKQFQSEWHNLHPHQFSLTLLLFLPSTFSRVLSSPNVFAVNVDGGTPQRFPSNIFYPSLFLSINKAFWPIPCFSNLFIRFTFQYISSFHFFLYENFFLSAFVDLLFYANFIYFDNISIKRRAEL
jgi:hypothetical protein